MIGHDDNGEPIYIKGIKGVIERNIMRYYFVLLVEFDKHNVHYEQKLENWFAYTERYHRQLYEYEKTVFMQAKLKERENQFKLQKLLGH
ncbi:MAG: hypothetical protein HUJ30_01020 [Gammaproteobacteria bacterium]|nr:hypothetical protein [Gammaproteobacteria bacterium]